MFFVILAADHRDVGKVVGNSVFLSAQVTSPIEGYESIAIVEFFRHVAALQMNPEMALVTANGTMMLVHRSPGRYFGGSTVS